MKIFKKGLAAVVMATVFILGLTGPISAFAATSPTLGDAESYSVLGHTTVTNTGATTMPGDLGISIGGAPTGFPPGVVGPPGEVRNAGDSLAAQNANTVAYGALSAGDNATCTSIPVELSGQTLVPGVYCSGGVFTLNGTLTLTGTGVWIFQSTATLITSGTANVVGGDPCNVWWKVPSSATLGTNTSLIGNILASTSISMATGASLNGRALAQTGAVTLDSNTFTGTTCVATAATAGAAARKAAADAAAAKAAADAAAAKAAADTAAAKAAADAAAAKLPNTGAPHENSIPWNVIILSGILVLASASTVVILRKRKTTI